MLLFFKLIGFQCYLFLWRLFLMLDKFCSLLCLGIEIAVFRLKFPFRTSNCSFKWPVSFAAFFIATKFVNMLSRHTLLNWPLHLLVRVHRFCFLLADSDKPLLFKSAHTFRFFIACVWPELKRVFFVLNLVCGCHLLLMAWVFSHFYVHLRSTSFVYYHYLDVFNYYFHLKS